MTHNAISPGTLVCHVAAINPLYSRRIGIIIQAKVVRSPSLEVYHRQTVLWSDGTVQEGFADWLLKEL